MLLKTPAILPLDINQLRAIVEALWQGQSQYSAKQQCNVRIRQGKLAESAVAVSACNACRKNHGRKRELYCKYHSPAHSKYDLNCFQSFIRVIAL